MYRVNDYIIYANTGVCQITEITAPGFNTAQKELLYYVLKPLQQNCKIYAPTNTKAYMRPILSADEVHKLIQDIPEIQPDSDIGSNKQQLEERYRTVMKTHDCASYIRFAISLYRKKNEEEPGKKSALPYERIMKQVEEHLYGEFSMALGIPVEQVQSYIASKLEASEKACAWQAVYIVN